MAAEMQTDPATSYLLLLTDLDALLLGPGYSLGGEEVCEGAVLFLLDAPARARRHSDHGRAGPLDVLTRIAVYSLRQAKP